MTAGRITIHALDPHFALLFDPARAPWVLHEGTVWAEGPAWDPASGALYFSDVPSNVLYRRSADGAVSEFRAPSDHSNGNTVGPDGRLLSCEQATRRIVRTEPDGGRTVLVDRYRGSRINSPNDLVVASDGAVWFTDPDYGIRSEDQGGVAPRELDGCYVFRLGSDGRLDVMADDLVMPNGLAFSPDGRRLYVADSAYTVDPAAPRHVRVYDVAADGALSGSRVLVEVDEGWPDGLRVDEAGRLWCAAGDGVRCYTAEGRQLGTIRTPEIAANLCFAVIDGAEVVVVTASSRVWAVPLRVV